MQNFVLSRRAQRKSAKSVKLAFKKITAVYLLQKSTLFIVFDEFKNLYFTFNRILNNIYFMIVLELSFIVSLILSRQIFIAQSH